MAKRPRTRAQRRADTERIKAKARMIATRRLLVPDPDDRLIGMLARTPKPCSCWMCSFGKYDRPAEKRAAELSSAWDAGVR